MNFSNDYGGFSTLMSLLLWLVAGHGTDTTVTTSQWIIGLDLLLAMAPQQSSLVMTLCLSDFHHFCNLRGFSTSGVRRARLPVSHPHVYLVPTPTLAFDLDQFDSAWLCPTWPSWLNCLFQPFYFILVYFQSFLVIWDSYISLDTSSH